jgi:Ca2+-binding EF-hand superfamily protein
MKKQLTFVVIAFTLAASSAQAQSPAAPASSNSSAGDQISAEQVISNNDQNKDGIVTKEEATKANRQLIQQWNNYDLNKDGKVDVAEFKKAAAQVEALEASAATGGEQFSAEQVISNNDQNKDGIVTKQEAAKANRQLIQLWDSFDLNKDGKVDVAEVRKVSAQNDASAPASSKPTGQAMTPAKDKK